MKVGWLIDAVAFESYHDELVEAVRRNGLEAVSVTRPQMPYQWEDVDSSYRLAFPKGACVVAHGDIDLVQRVRADELWTPGVFATVERFYCSSYYAYLGKYLLNQRYCMLPFGELPRTIDFLVAALGNDGKIFVRPDSPLKAFTGQVISRAEFERDFEFIGFNGIASESLIIVSTPQTIVAEWRFVVADGSLVAGSLYKLEGEFVSLPNEDEGASAFAQSLLLAGYQPDPVWVLDIGKTVDGTYHLIEIGGFSFAGLYACDKNKVVDAVSKVAWQLYHENANRKINRRSNRSGDASHRS